MKKLSVMLLALMACGMLAFSPAFAANVDAQDMGGQKTGTMKKDSKKASGGNAYGKQDGEKKKKRDKKDKKDKKEKKDRKAQRDTKER